MVQQPSYWKVLTRRKVLATEGADGDTKLNRVLGLYDLTALGVGSTLGAGVYVLAGQIARDQAGPSVMLSFAIAALASLLAGVCYAEFGARVPKAGSAYVYSYVCIGEFAAFVIGWNLILEYVIGTAAVCRGISVYLDTIINDTLKNTFAEIAPMNVSFFGSYFDFFAFGLVVVFGVALAFGVETSAMANNFCTCLNISILLFVIIAGSIKANFSNWTINVDDVIRNDTNITTDLGTGGYFPFGFEGTLKGAATCFFGFVGFDCIATTGEEVRNPRKNIPRSILLSLLIIFLCYFGVSTVLTLMVPYYLQDPNAPLPYAFKEVGWTFAMWIVSVGGLIGLLASLFGALFPLPRVMYSMAEDGLLFRFLGKVSVRYRVPVIGSIFAAIMTSLIAGVFDLAQLVNLLSIGTLLAYSVVAISITILRYMDNAEESDRENGNEPPSENSMLTSGGTRITFKALMVQLFNCRRLHTPNALSTRIVGTLITVFCLLSLAIGLVFMQAFDALITNQLWVLVLLGVLVALTLLVLLSICLQPREIYSRMFRVPFVPIVPAVSIFINIYLMLQLDVMTWIRFGVWMAIGIPIFIACWCMYDIKNPAKRNLRRVSFARALRRSPGDCDDDDAASPANGHLKENGLDLSGSLNSGTNGSNGTTLSIQNEHSVKSLDEIMAMDEVGGDLIEMKHANGNKFYIEDTRSNSSNTQAESNGGDSSSARNETTEEEKSVIAMLDDVLQGEDDGGLPTPGIPGYDRKFSVDSEMQPCVIETTTVATVHSSSSDSSEQDPEELTEVDGRGPMSRRSLSADFDRYAESQRVANTLVDEVLASSQLWRAIEEHLRKQEAEEDLSREEVPREELTTQASVTEEPTNVEPPPVVPDSPPMLRSTSEASLLSVASVDDPMHSEKFKNKLSKIIMAPPAPQVVNKPVKEKKDPVAKSNESPRPTLKQSKSEADIRKLVLKAIEGTGINIDDDDGDSGSNGSSTAAKDAEGIPKPPKFDPVLYKTLNSLNTTRERPSLQKLLSKDAEPMAAQKKVEEESPPVPFKAKLEAILKRGPSHRTQQRPEVQQRRPKSMGPALAELEKEENAVEESAEDLELQRKRMTTKSESNLNQLPDAAEAINDARKSLKPVKYGAKNL